MVYFISNFLIFLLLVSCSQNISKLSKVAKINEKDRYVNNYVDDYNIGRLKFLKFFWNNIFDKPNIKEFESVELNSKIYEKDAHVLTWGGHSTVLYQNNNLNILVDPIFSERASPFSFLGYIIYSGENSLPPEVINFFLFNS